MLGVGAGLVFSLLMLFFLCRSPCPVQVALLLFEIWRGPWLCSIGSSLGRSLGRLLVQVRAWRGPHLFFLFFVFVFSSVARCPFRRWSSSSWRGPSASSVARSLDRAGAWLARASVVFLRWP